MGNQSSCKCFKGIHRFRYLQARKPHVLICIDQAVMTQVRWQKKIIHINWAARSFLLLH